MKTITIRLDQKDITKIEEMKERISNAYKELYSLEWKMTNSDILRACIRYTYDHAHKFEKWD